MNVLIVLAHPEPKSFNHAMKDLAVETFTQAGHSVQVSDLYAMGFNPVLDKGDFQTLARPDFFKPQLEQRHATATHGFAADVAAEQEKVFWADLVVFQFPLWWFSLPAILKGWVDRVFAAGLTYGGGMWYDQGAFRGKKAMLALTTGGPSAIYGPDGINGDLEATLFHVQHGMLFFCGFEVITPYVAWSAAHLDDEGRQQLLEGYRRHLQSLDDLPRVPFHPLADYDDALRLKSGVRD